MSKPCHTPPEEPNPPKRKKVKKRQEKLVPGDSVLPPPYIKSKRD